MARTEVAVNLGRASCFACRNSKRRCDRTLPTCQLCRRKDVECCYPRRRGQKAASPAVNSDSIDLTLTGSGVQSRSARGDGTSEEASTTDHFDSTTANDSTVASFSPLASITAIRFLNPDLYRDIYLQRPSSYLSIPNDVLDHLGDRQELREVTNAFLLLTRSWMPILNGKRHLAAIMNPIMSSLPCSTALLALSMKLYYSSACSRLNRAAQHGLYLSTKRFYAEVERTKELSISVIQAGVFIAVFEMGEAIFPAAYMTVGNLVRYGIAMGLDKINQDRMGSSAHLGVAAIGSSWIDIEEMRRVWWGVLILDRLLNVTHPTWSLVSKDPTFEDFLPVDDEKFYNASATPEDAAPISHAFHHRLGAFARLCQATYLISKVFELARSSEIIRTETSADESPCDSFQLCRTLEALVRANEVEVSIRKLPFCSQSLVSYLGVFLLQQQRWQQWQENGRATSHGESEELIFREMYSALDTLDRISKAVRDDIPETRPSPKHGQSTLFLVELVYQGILTLMMLKEGLPPQEFQDKVDSLKWLLNCMMKRWRLAAIYQHIVEAKEAMMVIADI